MIPRSLIRWLAARPGPIGERMAAYRELRWGDPYLRLLRALCDPRRVSVDVGAHGGLYTWFLRRHSARCIAFEPNPDLAALLRQRFPSGVDIRNQALSDTPGKAVLRVPTRSAKPDPGRATIEAGNLLSGSSAIHDQIEVETVTLDQAIHEAVGFIKIDVEGHELNVLRGAEHILREHRPNLIVELEDQHLPGIVAAAFAWLGERGYRGWFLEGAKVRPIDAFAPHHHQNDKLPQAWVNNFVFSVDPATGDRLRR